MDDELGTHLLRLETALVNRNPAGVEGGLPDLIADDFLEFGASGRTWDADDVREEVASPGEGPDMALDDVSLTRLAADVALLIYRVGAPRPANRSSIWVRRGGRWLMRFHQGTLRPDDA